MKKKYGCLLLSKQFMLVCFLNDVIMYGGPFYSLSFSFSICINKHSSYEGSSPTQVNKIRREAARIQRKILGSWKQYSDREFSGGFRQIPVLSDRIRPEIIGKNLENSRREYCFHVPDISRVFLRDLVAGTIDLRTGESLIRRNIHDCVHFTPLIRNIRVLAVHMSFYI
jgi:hypothetical protein